MVDPEIRELLSDVAMLRQEISELQKLLQEFQNILSEAHVRFRPPSPKVLLSDHAKAANKDQLKTGQ